MKHCMVIDDSNVIRKVARHIIETFGYRVSEAETCEEALDRIRTDMPDLLLLDWQLPNMSPIEFLTALRESNPEKWPYVVYCTSENDPGDIGKAFAAGADDYLLKPFNREVLQSKFDEIRMAGA